VTRTAVRISGHTLIELVVALGLMLLVAAGVITLLLQTSRLARMHPERFELHQRARVALDLITRDLRAAGAGVYLGPATGPLSDAVPAIWPRRLGRGGDSASTARADVLTLLAVPDTLAQTTTLGPVSAATSAIVIEPAVHCTLTRPACGFVRGITVGVFEPSGRLGLWSVEQVINQTLSVQPLASTGDDATAGAVITELRVRGYAHDNALQQLRYFDGDATNQPVVDAVTAFSVRYFDAAAELPASMFTDGPWRGSGATMFDEDLLRIRRVRVAIELAEGRARYAATVDVAPRNVGRL
jgi:type II secretory pathway pseudopilin PulG